MEQVEPSSGRFGLVCAVPSAMTELRWRIGSPCTVFFGKQKVGWYQEQWRAHEFCLQKLNGQDRRRVKRTSDENLEGQVENSTQERKDL